MQITILKPGLLSTIQDLGRYQHLAQAVSVSGAMDPLAARLANICLGNNEGSAVIEFTYAGAMFRTESDVLIAHSGGGAILKAGDEILPAHRPVFIPAATNVSLVHTADGARTFLAIVGGWEIPDVLSSKSTALTAGFGGMDGRALKAGDVLNGPGQLTEITPGLFNQLKGDCVNYTDWSIPAQVTSSPGRNIIRVVRADEFDWFDSESVIDFFNTPFAVGQRSNRMGYHLEGNVIGRINTDELLSTAVTPGTIQVTGNGSLILLMADGQTTGGYPRIAQVAAADLPLCAQLKPGDAIYFTEISREDAEKLYIEQERHIQKLTTALRHKFLF